MASKSVYQDFDPAGLKHFGLSTAPVYGVVDNQRTQVHEVIVSNDEDTYNKIRKTLSKPNTTVSSIKSLPKKQKAFMLPLSPVSLSRAKAACKAANMTLTNDYEEADVIITHDKFHEKNSHGSKIANTLLMARLWNYETITSSTNRVPIIESYYADTRNSVICDMIDMAWRVNQGWSSIYEGYLITGMAVNIAFRIATMNVSCIKADDLVCEAILTQPITEELIQDLTNQIKSGDLDTVNLAGMILPTVDYTSNLHLLWKFAQDVGDKMHLYNRSKDVRAWMQASKFNTFYHYTAERMIQYLEKEGKLDSTSFRYLEPIVRKDIKIYNRDLYIFKVEVKPRYQQYLKKVTNE